MKAPSDKQQQYLKDIIAAPKLIEILSYCIMPNHYHFLVKQIIDNGIPKYFANLQNSYAKYYNLKHKRSGPIFNPRFKAKIIDREEVGLHLARYQHLNPTTARMLSSIEELKTYNWSSFYEFLQPKSIKHVADLAWLRYHFPSNEKFIAFHKDRLGYQQILADIYKECIDVE